MKTGLFMNVILYCCMEWSIWANMCCFTWSGCAFSSIDGWAKRLGVITWRISYYLAALGRFISKMTESGPVMGVIGLFYWMGRDKDEFYWWFILLCIRNLPVNDGVKIKLLKLNKNQLINPNIYTLQTIPLTFLFFLIFSSSSTTKTERFIKLKEFPILPNLDHKTQCNTL